MIIEGRTEFTEFEQALYKEWTGGTASYQSYNRKTTVCILKLRNGFEVVGTSGCEDPEKFDMVIGRVYALKDALRKLGEFAAFHRAEKAHQEKISKPLALSIKITPEQLEELRRAWEGPSAVKCMHPGIDVKQTLTY
jgi:hypothetical protein